MVFESIEQYRETTEAERPLKLIGRTSIDCLSNCAHMLDAIIAIRLLVGTESKLDTNDTPQKIQVYSNKIIIIILAIYRNAPRLPIFH